MRRVSEDEKRETKRRRKPRAAAARRLTLGLDVKLDFTAAADAVDLRAVWLPSACCAPTRSSKPALVTRLVVAGTASPIMSERSHWDLSGRASAAANALPLDAARNQSWKRHSLKR